MNYFPIFLKVKQQRCLVVGGGEVAARKIALLLRAEATVTVVAPELNEQIKAWADAGKIAASTDVFSIDQLEGSRLAIAATDDPSFNESLAEICQQLNIPVNVVDSPELSSFIVPSIIDRSPVIAAISSGGTSPTLARLLRAKLEAMIPVNIGKLAELAGRMREQVQQKLPSMTARRRFWNQTLEGPIAEQFYAGQEQHAETALQEALDLYSAGEMDESFIKGEVYLVGCGPGAPDLITFRALRLMQQADVVLYDRLIPSEVLDLVRREAEQIYVGKKRAYHSVRQEEISQLLVDYAKQGKRVLRLKGGDPFIFGRGGEEIAMLAKHGIPFQVVPGVTAAAGCASYAGIPLTHRDYSQSVIFVTGQLKDGTVDLNWKALAEPQQTIVVYMGMMGLSVLCQQLIAHGLSPQTPAALIQKGTTPEQKVFTSHLQALPDIAKNNEIHAPTLIIIGEVVKLRAEMGVFG
ncbi:MAG: siroheme synthase CysG [Gammaproteobacteria bacterium]|nr:siroheme synthase CysG [Gammaproteobacteria bacterium]